MSSKHVHLVVIVVDETDGKVDRSILSTFANGLLVWDALPRVLTGDELRRVVDKLVRKPRTVFILRVGAENLPLSAQVDSLCSHLVQHVPDVVVDSVAFSAEGKTKNPRPGNSISFSEVGITPSDGNMRTWNLTRKKIQELIGRLS